MRDTTPQRTASRRSAPRRAACHPVLATSRIPPQLTAYRLRNGMVKLCVTSGVDTGKIKSYMAVDIMRVADPADVDIEGGEGGEGESDTLQPLEVISPLKAEARSRKGLRHRESIIRVENEKAAAVENEDYDKAVRQRANADATNNNLDLF